jgi:hypothetical protein
MRRLGSFASVLVLAAVGASAAFGVSPPIKYRPIAGPVGTVGVQTGLKVTASSHRQGAKPVTVTLRYTGPLRCGRPMGATIVLPSAVGIGAKTPVTMNGKPGTVTRRGHSLKVSTPSTGVMCDSIVDGAVTVQVGGLANPAMAGSYLLRVATGAATYSGALSIQ